jgi:hypothetical protein
MASTQKTTAPVTPQAAPAKKAAAKSPVAKKSSSVRPVAEKSAAPKSRAIAKKPGAGALPSQALAKALAKATLEKAAKAEKAKKPKLVRDSFTIPKAEYLVLDELKQRATRLTRPAKKSELLRAGIKALAALSDAAFLTALEQVPAIKTGRPALKK